MAHFLRFPDDDLPALMSELFSTYELGRFYDEMFSGRDGPRPHYARVYERLAAMSRDELAHKQALADQTFLWRGVTFTWPSA